MRGRCFISEPRRPYVIGDRVMLETRDGRRIFGVVQQIREMRTGSVSLILDIEGRVARGQQAAPSDKMPEDCSSIGCWLLAVDFR